MESDLEEHSHFVQEHQQKQMNSGLTRYQSAPSSYFSSFQDKDFIEDLLNRPASPETERIFARFLANSETDNVSNQSFVKQEQEQHLVASINNNNSDQTRLHQQQQQQQSNFSSGFYQSQAKPPLPDQNPMVTSLMKPSNLIRHSSSPAGLFSNINIDMENGFAVIRGVGDFRTGNRETSYSSASKPPASSLRMSPIAEIGKRSMVDNTPDSGGFEETPGNNYGTGFSVGAWDDAAAMSDGIKGLTDDGRTLSGVNASENHRGDMGNRSPMLAHHLSLPKTSAELSAIENYLQLQDSVPCKIRAKRGCATHPRSIAERVRRTRISERMRKLQDLVPNMDKQTNTSDMLDLAVDYIKDLQKQVKTLSESRSRCACSSTQQQC